MQMYFFAATVVSSDANSLPRPGGTRGFRLRRRHRTDHLAVNGQQGAPYPDPARISEGAFQASSAVGAAKAGETRRTDALSRAMKYRSFMDVSLCIERLFAKHRARADFSCLRHPYALCLQPSAFGMRVSERLAHVAGSLRDPEWGQNYNLLFPFEPGMNQFCILAMNFHIPSEWNGQNASLGETRLHSPRCPMGPHSKVIRFRIADELAFLRIPSQLASQA